jgi:hypothetical protein
VIRPNDRPTRAASGVRIGNCRGPPAFGPVIFFGSAFISGRPELRQSFLGMFDGIKDQIIGNALLSHLSLCHQQIALILDAESFFCQVEIPVQVDNSPADVAVRRISGHPHEFVCCT